MSEQEPGARGEPRPHGDITGGTFYRAARYNPPDRRDYLSDDEAGSPRADWEEDRHRHGFSVWKSKADARGIVRLQVRRRRWPKGFVAEIFLPGDGSITVERSGPSKGHHTLYGDADDVVRHTRIAEAVN